MKEKDEFQKIWELILSRWLQLTSLDLPFSFWQILIITFIVLLSYINIFDNSFVFDDLSSITLNNSIKDLSKLINSFKLTSMRFVGTLTFAINYQLGQLSTFGYHVINLIIHLITTLVVWRLSVSILESLRLKDETLYKVKEWFGLLVALFFLTHPLQTQAVTYTVQRYASLATLFYLLALFCFAKIFQVGKGKKQILLISSSLISAVLGFYTKEIVFTLPIIALLYYVLFVMKQGLKKHTLFVLVPLSLFFLSFIYVALSTYPTELSRTKTTPWGESVNSYSYLLTQSKVVVKYISMVFVPIHQVLDHYVPVVNNLLSFDVLFSLGIISIILMFALNQIKKRPLLTFGILWFFITLGVESSIIPLEDLMVEHRLYLPMYGASVAIISGLFYLFKQKARIVIMVVSLVVLINAFVTYNRNKVWENGFTLWSDVVAKSPQIRRGFNNLGVLYLQSHRPDLALPYLQQALVLSPDYLEAMANTGYAYALAGNFSQAESHYNKVLEKDSEYMEVHNNMGVLLLNQRRFDDALPYVLKAYEHNMYADATNYNLGIIYAFKGDRRKAKSFFEASFKLNPDFVKSYQKLPKEFQY